MQNNFLMTPIIEGGPNVHKGFNKMHLVKLMELLDSLGGALDSFLA